LNDWRDLEHHLWQELNERDLLDKKILVGFSGGVDSLALLWGLVRTHKEKITGCFVHHGPGPNQPYRDRALEFCQNFCAERKIPFVSQINEKTELSSEAALREFRYEALRKTQKQTGSALLALGHHREDLLETRLLRLIRGTGPQGLPAMNELQEGLFRPFLKKSKKELLQYLESFGLSASEDPSNADLEPLRNWIRQDWLVALENRQEGAVHALARSLETLAESVTPQEDFSSYFENNALLRGPYLALSKTQQKRVLALLLLRQKVQNFTQSHLEEVQKRLDNPQKGFSFRVAGREWLINAQQIRVQDSE
jgi:tRNA(Ile)-lysidine synthase